MEENKFSFSEEEENEQDEAVQESKEAVAEDAKGLWNSINTFLRNVFDFKSDTDREATVEAIKNDIPFKGATAWILICSIFVASVGLNANSTAVVIGAMLISPLMGPILGVGFSIAVNDIDTLKRSLINLAIMIVLSLITAFLFFYFFPLSEDTSELLGRTRPDIRDVLIAFFGGLALIIARCKRGTIASVIFGVAIATALMPPLCTAGYGLAKAKWDFFGGAMYLFGINTIFIALATFIVLKLLRFPMEKYANSKKRKRIAQLAMLLAIIAMIPAGWTFVNVLKESNFKNAARAFINEEITDKRIPNSQYVRNNAEYYYHRNADSSFIKLNIFGLDVVPDSSKSVLNYILQNEEKYLPIKNAPLIFNDFRLTQIDNFRFMEEQRSRDSLDLLSNQQQIRALLAEIGRLKLIERNQSFDEITKEVKHLFDGRIKEFGYSKQLLSNFSETDTLSVFTISWNDSLSTSRTKSRDSLVLSLWLKERMDIDTLKLDLPR